MNILSATDFLPKSDAAIERAAFLADLLKAELTIAHAVAPAAPDGCTLDERVRNARSRLSKRITPPDWRWNANPDIAVQFGRPARVVLDQAHRRNSRLVVLGPHRNSSFPDTVSGSITERVLGAALCPLLIARRQVNGPYREVLVALDDAPQAGEVVRMVESLHLAVEGSATVVHAHEPPHAGMMDSIGAGPDATADYVSAQRAQAVTGIRDLLQINSSDAHRYEIMIIERRPASAILGAIERLQPDLVVLGSGAQGRLRRVLLGSVASDVARAANCDVLLVPNRATVPMRERQPRSSRPAARWHSACG